MCSGVIVITNTITTCPAISAITAAKMRGRASISPSDALMRPATRARWGARDSGAGRRVKSVRSAAAVTKSTGTP